MEKKFEKEVKIYRFLSLFLARSSSLSHSLSPGDLVVGILGIGLPCHIT